MLVTGQSYITYLLLQVICCWFGSSLSDLKWNKETLNTVRKVWLGNKSKCNKISDRRNLSKILLVKSGKKKNGKTTCPQIILHNHSYVQRFTTPSTVPKHPQSYTPQSQTVLNIGKNKRGNYKGMQHYSKVTIFTFSICKCYKCFKMHAGSSHSPHTPNSHAKMLPRSENLGP